MKSIVTVDEKRRIRIGNAKPGQRVQVQSTEDGWKVSLVRQDEDDAFPPGSLLKYITPEFNREQMQIFKGCVKGPGRESDV